MMNRCPPYRRSPLTETSSRAPQSPATFETEARSAYLEMSGNTSSRGAHRIRVSRKTWAMFGAYTLVMYLLATDNLPFLPSEWGGQLYRLTVGKGTHPFGSANEALQARRNLSASLITLNIPHRRRGGHGGAEFESRPVLVFIPEDLRESNATRPKGPRDPAPLLLCFHDLHRTAMYTAVVETNWLLVARAQ
eukprot:RCo031643